MKRFIVYTLSIVICFVLQSAMFHYIALANVMPNLLLILVVSFAYMRGRITGLFLGFFSGILVDIIFGNVIGLYALLYLLIGYFIGFTNRFYSNDDYTLPIIFVAVSDFIYGFFYYIFEFLLRGRLDFLFYLRRFIFPEIIYTVTVSVFLYKLLHMINNRLNARENEEA
ncbi:rod shape-determining protein MreD [Mobilitalea sibirica]|uniref:Rod shape-determining protein MreD n=1 Tax=Mobilitalea sibirica TaxID=1462919 RepID=A0A8J7KW28_9FIRM|nr:rod shape-determining protein MreD [Mobilitalea sibirica]